MVDKARALRMADRIKQLVAESLEKRVKDPRLGFVTITDVRLTGDLQHASIFYTVFGDAEERTNSAAALKSATGMLRSEVGKSLGVRITPTLEFIADAIPENAQTIEQLLHEAAMRDAEVAALATNATFAGEADPYRKHDEADVDLDAADAADVADASGNAAPGAPGATQA